MEKVPKFVNAEALDEFASTGFSSKALTPRYVIIYNQLLSDTKMHIVVICYPETCTFISLISMLCTLSYQIAV